MKRAGVDVHRDLGVGLAAEALELVDDRAAAAGALGDVDLDVEALEREQAGVDHVGDGEGIVHWGVVMPIDLEMEPPVEGVQVGDHGACVTLLTQAPRRGRR